MSDVETQPASPHSPLAGTEHQGAHEGPIRTPRQLIIAILYSFVVPVAVIVLLVLHVASGLRPAAGTDVLAPDAVARRLEPVGAVVVKDASDPSTQKTGEQVFAGQCTTCHSAGLVGAPKFGDAGAWAPRIQTGYAALLNSALHGKGNMGPQGGGDYTDLEVARAVVYMADKAGATFPEPQAAPDAGPAAATTAGAPDTAAAATATAAGPVAATTTAAADVPAAAAPATAGATPATAPASPSAATPAAPAVAAAPAPAPAAATTTMVAAAERAKPEAAGVAPALYGNVCQVCHAAGVAGAPKLGDKAAWEPRIAAAKGVDGLTASAIKGKGAMPPRGGSMASDADIKAVVTYMVNSAK